MPSVFSHAVVGSTLVACGLRQPRARLVAIGAALAMLPDLDVLGLAVGWGLDHPLGHRGLSHSLTAAAVLATIALVGARGREAQPARAGPSWWVWVVLFVATASHGVLDALTNGGRGVAFLAPFSVQRWHFDFRPIEVSPIGVRDFFLTGRGLEVIANELLWLWLPSLALLAMVWSLRRFSGPRTPEAHVPDR